jgi:dienelactone hydrolase
MNSPDPTMFRERLLACLGGPWPELPPPEVRHTADDLAGDGYRVEQIEFEAEPGDWVPALVLIPDGAENAPGIAIWHQHNGEYHLGKSEPGGLAGNPMHHTGVALAKAGFVVLCPDALCFEGRQDPTGKLQGGSYERFWFLKYVVRGKCLAWKNILDMRRAVDVLASRPEVDASRLGCYGHSMGSTHSWLVGPWEPRLRCVVGNCCLPTYRGIEREHLLHCFPNFIPGLAALGDMPDVAGLIAPRPLHLNFGSEDGGTPKADIAWSLERTAEWYEQAGASDAFTHYIEEGSGHVLSPEMWRRTLAFFEGHLK